MNGLILAAGKGSRLKKITEDTNKSLIDIGNNIKLIDYHVQRLLDLKLSVIIIVVNHQADKVYRHIIDKYSQQKIEFIFQNNLTGIVGAIDLYKKIYDEGFVLALADEFIDFDNDFVKKKLNNFISDGHDINIFAIDVSSECDKDVKISKTFSLKTNGDTLLMIKEKPLSNFYNHQGIGFGFYSKNSLRFLDKLEINKSTNQIDLDGWVNNVIRGKGIVKFHSLNCIYINVNTPQDLSNLKKIIK